MMTHTTSAAMMPRMIQVEVDMRVGSPRWPLSCFSLPDPGGGVSTAEIARWRNCLSGEMDPVAATCYGPASAGALRDPEADERSVLHHPARDRRRCARDRAAARAHVRPGALCPHGLSHSRAACAPLRPVIHRAHRHAAGGIGALD